MQLRRFSIVSLISIASVFAFSNPTLSQEPNPLFAVLLGGNEINSVTGRANAGDPDGVGSATVIVYRRLVRVCFGITVNSISQPTALHIHRGIAGVNGGVVVPLAPVPNMGGGITGASGGCVNLPNTPANVNLLREIQEKPSNFYVNIHNQNFPGGALRGQLF